MDLPSGTMGLTEWAVNLALLGLPPLTCLWAWWLWSRNNQSQTIPKWRQVGTLINLIVLTVSLVFGAFALIYWRDFAGTPVQPEVTRIATVLGFALAVFGMPFSIMPRSWNRVAQMIGSLGLIAFYVGMFAAG